MRFMASADAAADGASEAIVRQHAAELARLAARHGIHNLRFASVGRLLGQVDDDRDLLDMAAFAAAAQDLLGAPVSILSDAVLRKPNVSEDLVHATAL